MAQTLYLVLTFLAVGRMFELASRLFALTESCLHLQHFWTAGQFALNKKGQRSV